MPLATIGEYVEEARVLLQDTREPYRYLDTEVKSAIGIGVFEMSRLRSDIFLGRNVPDITSATNNGQLLELDVQYRAALLYYIVGHMKMREEEEGSENTGAAWKNGFVRKLLSLEA